MYREASGSTGELLATDHRQTLEFFIVGLRTSDPQIDQQSCYNASVLAHCARYPHRPASNGQPRELSQES